MGEAGGKGRAMASQIVGYAGCAGPAAVARSPSLGNAGQPAASQLSTLVTRHFIPGLIISSEAARSRRLPPGRVVTSPVPTLPGQSPLSHVLPLHSMPPSHPPPLSNCQPPAASPSTLAAFCRRQPSSRDCPCLPPHLGCSLGKRKMMPSWASVPSMLHGLFLHLHARAGGATVAKGLG